MGSKEDMGGEIWAGYLMILRNYSCFLGFVMIRIVISKEEPLSEIYVEIFIDKMICQTSASK